MPFPFCQPNQSSMDGGALLPTNLESRSQLSGPESLMAKELNGLTVEEREQVYDDVHGISNIIDENPDFVAAKLLAMRNELERIPKKNRKALDRAIFLRPGLQNDETLYLLFLRATKFDAVKAAGLMTRHFEHKLHLFGDSLLPAKITIADLGEKEAELLHSGAVALLDSIDRRGRGVYLMTVSEYDISDRMAFIRVAWYQIMSTLESNEAMQKIGVVQVLNFYGEWKHTPSELLDYLWHMENIVRDWPFRPLGIHLCYDQSMLRSFLDCIHIVAGKDLRVRERCHFGSKLEGEYSLLSFGIRVSGWFSPGQGMLSKEHLATYVDDRRQREAEWRRQEYSDPKFMRYPTRHMVLMGRGRPYREWLANIELSKLVSMHADRYMGSSVDRVDKAMIAIEIVQRVQILGGRFVRRTDEGWVTVDDQVSKEKVSQALRAEVRLRNSSTVKSESESLATPMFHTSNFDAELSEHPEQKRVRLG